MPDYEYAIHSSKGEHLWPLSNVEDLPVFTTKAACVGALAGYDPDFWDGDEVIVVSPVRKWEVSWSAMEDLETAREVAKYREW